jgi:hypothetical protein
MPKLAVRQSKFYFVWRIVFSQRWETEDSETAYRIRSLAALQSLFSCAVCVCELASALEENYWLNKTACLSDTFLF